MACSTCGKPMDGIWNEATGKGRVECGNPLCDKPARGPWRTNLAEAEAAYRRSVPDPGTTHRAVTQGRQG